MEKCKGTEGEYMAWSHFLGFEHLIPKDPRFTARGKSVNNILFASVDYCVTLQMSFDTAISVKNVYK